MSCISSEPESTNVLAANQLKKTFGVLNRQIALNDVDIEIERGECIAIAGRNGAGKTTLLKILSGIHAPTSGSLEVRGSIAYQPENLGIYTNISAGTAIRYFSNFSHGKENVEELLNLLKLPLTDKQPSKNYSKGMKRKVAFGMMLVTHPDLFVLDEPFEGLDPGVCHEMIDIINREKESGKSFIISSHDLGYVEKIADRVLLMESGRFVKHFDSLRNDVMIRFVSSREVTLNCLRETGVKFNADNFPYVAVTTNLEISELLADLVKFGTRFDEVRRKSLDESILEVM